MKKALALFAGILLIAGAYFFGTIRGSDTVSAPSAEWADGSDTAKAWQELGISFEAAGAKVFEVTDDPRERRDGLQYLSQLMAAALEMKLTKGDRARPAFTDWMGDDRKILGDSPDAVYHTAEVSADHSYEITGQRGDAEYLGVMLYGRGLNGWNRAASNINHDTLQFDEFENFRVVMSKTKPKDGADWLHLEDDIHMVMVRQYFHDRPDKTEARFTIHNLNMPEIVIDNDIVLASRMRDAAMFFNDSLKGTLALADMLIATPNSSTPPTSYNQDFGGIFYPTEDNQYLGTWFSLLPDQALIIEGDAPDVDYWSISLQNRWLQSFDYENHQTSLDNHKIKTKDGRYRVVISAQKLKSENWLDTAGYNSGLIAIRYQLAGKIPPPTMTVVKLADIAPQ